MATPRPPQTARIQTAGRTRQGRAIATGTVLEPSALPTSHGIAVQPGTSRGRRNVQDASFWISELSNRIQLIRTESSKLEQTTNRYSNEVANKEVYKEKVIAMQREVKNLVNGIGDYNLLLEKSNATPETLLQEQQSLLTLNSASKRIVEELLERKERQEKLLQSSVEELQNAQKEAQIMITNLSPQLKAEYAQLQKAKQNLENEVGLASHQITMLNEAITKDYQKLGGSDPDKLRAFDMQKKLISMRLAKTSISKELERSQKSTQDVQEVLLNQVKNDNQEISAMERKISEFQEKIFRLNQDLSREAVGNNEDEYEVSKVQKTLEDAQKFIDNFDSTKDQLQNQVDSLNLQIQTITKQLFEFSDHVSLLNSVSESNSGNPQELLLFIAREKDQKQQDYEKCLQLETRADLEFKSLKQQIATVEADLIKFSNVDKMKASALEQKKKMQDEKMALTRQIQEVKKRQRDVEAKYETERKKLSENDTFAQLNALEQKIKYFESNNYQMKEANNLLLKESSIEDSKKCALGAMSEYNQKLTSVLNGVNI